MMKFYLAVLAVAVLCVAACMSNGAKMRFAVSFPQEQSKDAAGRARAPDCVRRAPNPSRAFRSATMPIRSRSSASMSTACSRAALAIIDGGVLGYPRKSLADIPPGEYFVQAVLHRYETFHRADGHTVKLPMDRGEGQHWNQAPGKSVQHAAEGADRSGIRHGNQHPARPDHPADPRAAGHEVRQARQNPERAADQILGAADAPRRGRAAARGLRFPPERTISADGEPRALPAHLRGLSRNAARSGSQARIQQAFPARGLQPDPAGVRLPILQGLDRAGLSALPDRHDPACKSVLRRFLRRELGQPRPVRRRDQPRADPVRREEVPRARPGMGALHLRRIDRRMGGAGHADVLSRRLQRLLRRLPRSDRFPRLHGGQHLRGQERLLHGRGVEAHAAAGHARTTSAT